MTNTIWNDSNGPAYLLALYHDTMGLQTTTWDMTKQKVRAWNRIQNTREIVRKKPPKKTKLSKGLIKTGNNYFDWINMANINGLSLVHCPQSFFSKHLTRRGGGSVAIFFLGFNSYNILFLFSFSKSIHKIFFFFNF